MVENVKLGILDACVSKNTYNGKIYAKNQASVANIITWNLLQRTEHYYKEQNFISHILV